MRSVAGVFLLVQIALIYFFNAYAKQGEPWRAGTAVGFALREDLWIHPRTSAWLAQFPALCTLLTYGAIAVEYLIPVLVLSPIKTAASRTIAVLLIAGLHLGLAVFLDLGLFPLVGLLVAVVLIPSPVWDRWRRSGGGERNDVGSDRARAPRRIGAIPTALVSAAFGLMLVQNLSYLKLPGAFVPRFEPQRYLYSTTLFKQHWAMYAPSPTTDPLWVKVVAPTEDGGYVDLRTGRGIEWEAGRLEGYKSYPLMNFVYGVCGGSPLAEQLLDGWLRHELREWNATHPGQPLDAAQAIIFTRSIQPSLEVTEPRQLLLAEVALERE